MHWPPAVYIAFALGLLLGRWTAGQRSTRPPQAAGPPPWEAYPTPTASATAGEGPFQIWLAEPGRNKIATIKAIRSVTHLGLREAKDLCESAPAPLLRVHSHGDADAVAQQFANVARLEIRALPF